MIRLAIFTFLIASLAIAIAGCSAPKAELYDGPIVGELQSGWDDGDESFDHEVYEELLQAHVDSESGTVDYAALQQEEEKLDSYLSAIADVDVSTLPKNEQLALLINAYNAYTLKLIAENYPLDSIRDISSPWTTERYEVGGHTLSLDGIEHNLIRPLFLDPRIHFAVNCAAIDCPHLAEFAFTGDKIDEQLRERTEAILSNEKFLRVENDILHLPKVMDWYSDDFLSESFQGHASTLPEYVAPFTTDEVRQFIENHDGDPPTRFLDYDWGLNDTP